MHLDCSGAKHPANADTRGTETCQRVNRDPNTRSQGPRRGLKGPQDHAQAEITMPRPIIICFIIIVIIIIIINAVVWGGGLQSLLFWGGWGGHSLESSGVFLKKIGGKVSCRSPGAFPTL